MGRANASPLPPPLCSRHTHARTRELAEHHGRAAYPPLSSFGAAERARLHSNCDLPQPWYGMVMAGTRPSADHASGSVCWRCCGQAQRPGRRRADSRGWRTASARRRMSREARSKQPKPAGLGHREFAECHVRATTKITLAQAGLAGALEGAGQCLARAAARRAYVSGN